MKDIEYILGINLQLFAVQVTTQASLSDEMKTFYDMTLIDYAQANLVHDQFGQKRPIPQGSGKAIEFRKFAPLNKALTPITEGVTPDGNELEVTTVTATVAQYGDYITQSDVLELTAIDNTILEATKLLGRQAGLTLDTITREVLHTNTNITYASAWSGSTEVPVESQGMLDDTSVLKVDTIMQVVAKLQAANAPTINGDYVAIIHPYAAYDLKRDPEWIDSHKYAEPENLYTGEIGKISGVRFVQSTEAKIYRGADLGTSSRTLTAAANYSSATSAVSFSGSVAANALVGRVININGVTAEVTANTTSAMTLKEASDFGTVTSGTTLIYPGEGGKNGLAVFGTLVMGDGAYGVTEVTGGGLQTIVKQKGSAGTSDPLDQRSSVGWKAIKTAEILIPDYLVCIKSCSPRYSSTAQAN